jgi:hypothetical protein
MKLKDKIGKPIIFAFIFTYTLFFSIGQAEGVHFGIIDTIEEKPLPVLYDPISSLKLSPPVPSQSAPIHNGSCH